MEDKFIYCEEAETKFGKTKKSVSYNGDVSVDYLTSNTSPTIETGAREYQREKVASLSWKQLIMLTVISNGYRKIPQIHIRVIKTNKTFRFELIDGQQRITSIIDFIRGGYSLPNTDDFNLGNGIDVRGMNITDIRENYPQVHQKIFGYRISCLWYENLSDEQTADLFINVLNNTNSMKPQEIRNAVRGYLSTCIRNTSRKFGNIDDRHPLFSRILSDGKSKKQRLEHFSPSFTINGRMEIDEWLSELIYLLQNGYKNGITQNRHTQWIKDVQQQGGSLGTSESFGEFDEDILQPLLSFSYDVITSTPNEYKYKLTPMLSQMLILYGYELKSKYGKLITDVYVRKFFSVYDAWSNTKLKLYSNELMFGTQDEQMEPFNKLFGGKNKKAIGTITYVLDMELKKDEDSFGVIEIDARDFTKPQIIQKWEEQGRICYFTGNPLELKDIAGDHYIPRSWGVKKGGVTEIDNLVVTSKKLNLRKLNVHGDDFKKMLNEEIEMVS
jgi:hypothetical protein